MCVWETESGKGGEKKRGKMKRLGGSCDSKCGREQRKKNDREKRVSEDDRHRQSHSTYFKAKQMG